MKLKQRLNSMPRRVRDDKQLACNLCSGVNLCEVVKVNDWAIHACRSCGFKFAIPSDGAGLALTEHYDEEYFSPLRERDSLRRWTQKYADRLDFATQHAPGNRVLDVGCGASSFPIIAADRGFRTSVLDGSPWAISFLKEHHQIGGSTCDLNNFSLERDSYDFIHSSHVIEHLYAPRQFLEQILYGLDNGGILFLTFPLYGRVTTSIRSLLWKLRLTNHPYTYDIPDHVSYFTRSTILHALRTVGFEIVAVKRYKYVSLSSLIGSMDGASLGRKLIKLAARISSPVTSGLGYYRDIEIYARKPDGLRSKAAPQSERFESSTAA